MAAEFKQCTADTLVHTGTGKICYVSIAPQVASPTAGKVTIYDAASETGTVIYSEWVFATAPGHTIELDAIVRNGIYVGFDGTLANVAVTVTYSG